MELAERKKRILKSIVDEYIRSGEPVGSKYISAHISDTLSSATVRNEMSDLESMGYLSQPHSSAGRIPTSKGIRIYVEDLMERYKLSLEELSVLNELLDAKIGEFGKLLSEAARVMSKVTNYTAISVLKAPTETIDVFRLVPLDNSNSFLLIMRCTNGEIKTKTIVAPVTDESLTELANAMNTVLHGLTVEEISLPVVLRLEELAGAGKTLVSSVLRAVNELLGSTEKESVSVQGLTKLLNYQEFYDVGKAKGVIEILEQKQLLINRLTGGMPGKANIVMSGEGLTPEDASVVFYPITAGGQTVGAIGVIGPKRMDYKKVIASLEYFASGLSDELNENNNGGM